MPYGQSALRGHSQAGDPFLGDIVKGIGKMVGAVVPGPIGAVGQLIGGRPAPQPRILAPRPQVGVMPGGAASRIFPGRPTTPMRVDPVTGAVVKKRRRMNYSNQKALRRALRRAGGYARQQKAVRKAASEFAREFGPKRRTPRRDLPRGHIHVR